MVEKPAYGFDAPGVIRGLFMAAIALFLAGGLAAALGGDDWIGRFAGPLLLICSAVPLILGSSMLVYVFVGKFRVRDRMLDLAALSGDEQLLDIGTGAGLLLIGAAKRLTTGHATGIDIWLAKDLSNNEAAVTRRNIALENVIDRVTLQDGDARSLAFADGTMDRVLSLFCLHNVEDKAERDTACHEIARVLRPGGVAVIGDYIPTHGYARALAAAGLIVESSRNEIATALTLAWITVARKPDAVA